MVNIDNDTISEIKTEITRLEEDIKLLITGIDHITTQINIIKTNLKKFNYKYISSLSEKFSQIYNTYDQKLHISNDNNHNILNDTPLKKNEYIKPLYRRILKKLHPDVNSQANLNLINFLNIAYRNNDIDSLIRIEKRLLDSKDDKLDNYEYLCYLSDTYDYYSEILENIEQQKNTLIKSNEYKLYVRYLGYNI